MPLYFAYGSNLDTRQMQRRCPSAHVVGIGRLPGHRLAFSRFSESRGCGVADIVAAAGQEVWGLLYELSEDDLSGSLDHCEGFPDCYTRLRLTVETLSDGTPDAWVYSVVDKDEHVEPDSGYLEIIRKAASEHGFPEEYRLMIDGFKSAD